MSAWSALTCKSSFTRLTLCVAATALLSAVWLLCQCAPLRPALAQSTPPSAPKATAAPTCVDCHAGAANSYAHAPMRHAMEIPGANPALETHQNLTVQKGQYTYTVTTRDGKTTYSVTDGTDTLTLPIRWMFGQQSQTWILEKDGFFYEGLVTYFAREQELGTTPGDSHITPHNITEAMGRKLTPWEVLQCFNCHATNAASGQKLTFDKLRPGLDCERCHTGAVQHMADAANDNFTTLPKALKKMDAQDTANFCGQCHRTWDTAVRNKWRGEVDVRFQPYRLENSKCFIGNDRRISCLACHDPHQHVNHDLTVYDAKCLACHAPAKSSATVAAIKSCPVAKANCVSCHMPKVQLPGTHSVFTDHEIRIARAGDPYPN